jgi:hypothetical protein
MGQYNNYTIECTVSDPILTGSEEYTSDITFTLKVNGAVIETYNTTQVGHCEATAPDEGGSSPVCTPDSALYHQTGFNSLRTLINSNPNSIIQMTSRGYDVEDGGIDPDRMYSFSGTFSGGVGGPTNGDLIDTIRTGPTATLIIIRSTEADNGSSITPSIAKRIQYWTGSQWSTYTPTP